MAGCRAVEAIGCRWGGARGRQEARDVEIAGRLLCPAPAPEFEIVYDEPERQADLAKLRSWLADKARGTTVLEIAYSAGY